jgi:very-short-patch-repair endonuclease
MVATRPFGPVGEFAASRHGALTRTQAATLGFTRKSVARLITSGIVREPVPGVLLVVGSPPTWHQRLYVSTLAANEAGVSAGSAAGALHTMDNHDQGPLEVLVPGHRHIAIDGLIIRRGAVDEQDVTEVDGIRCTTVARTLCDLGWMSTPEQQRLAFEGAWRRGTTLSTMRRTAQRLEGARTPGPTRLLALIDAAKHHGRPTESVLEVRVEAAIASLPGLVRQHVVRTSTGGFIARVDFAIPHLRIAIEAHSRRYHFGDRATEADADRESAMQAEGWIVRFITNANRKAPDALRRSLLALIAARERLPWASAAL